MENEELKKLLLETRDTIKKSLDGSENRKETIESYKRIFENFTDTTDRIVRSDDSRFIRGILLFHNSENFSKLTALHFSDAKTLTLIDHSGDKNLLEGLQDILKREIDLKSERDYYEIKISEKNNLTYMLYCTVWRTGESVVIFSSISSSQYFKKSSFLHLSGMIKNIFSINSYLNRTSPLDFFSDMLAEIDRTIRGMIDSGAGIEGYYYVFKSIEDIFKNSSLSTYSDLSGKIIDQLLSHHVNESKIFLLSVTRFLVLEKVRGKPEESSKSKGKVNIVYKGLPLPYEAFALDLDNYTNIYTLWEKISLFTSYISHGDISS